MGLCPSLPDCSQLGDLGQVISFLPVSVSLSEIRGNKSSFHLQLPRKTLVQLLGYEKHYN